MRVATFNAGLLDVRVVGRKLFEFTPHTRNRVNAVAKGLRCLSNDLDVLCIQEIYHSNDQRQVAEAVGDSLPYQFLTPPARWPRLNSGLMLFSRREILSVSHRYFRRQSPDEWLFSKKGFLTANISCDRGGSLKIINTHLSSGGLTTHPASTRAMQLRGNQIAELSILEPDAALLIGDLNCGPEADSRNFESLVHLSFTDLAALFSGGCTSPFYTWDPSNPLNRASAHSSSPPQRIDHILAKRQFVDSNFAGTSSRVLDLPVILDNGLEATPSDHYGVKIDFRLNLNQSS